MKTINLLSQETIDKIAAGEVVERPASVAKELIENSIDANATAITVELKGGGIEYLRITDDGEGIDKSQIQVAFLRHSTSKIASASDLESVRSLGFRGEALSSISAVSRVELITKTKDSLLGSHYFIEGAKEISLEDIGAPDGTTFIVRQLFFNTPARKKFLKSESTEASYIFDVVEHLALSHPEISFRLIANGRDKLVTSGNSSLSDVIYQIYGRQIATNVLDIDYQDEYYKISGFIGQSVVARGNRSFEHFYVNGRYIRSNNLSRACEEGYYGFLMGHQFPFFLLNITTISSDVDVNVHPTKQEVRFDNEPQLCEILTKIVHDRLLHREDIIEAEPESKSFEKLVIETIKNVPVEETTTEQATSEPSLETSEKPISKPSDPVMSNKPEETPHRAEPFEKAKLEAMKASIVEQIRQDTPYEKKFASNNAGGDKYDQISFLAPDAVKEHKIIGQVFDTYWIIEYDKKMYIIDQHAAHEKVLFEKTMTRLKDNQMTSQMITPPVVVSLSNTDMVSYNNCREALEALGYEIEEFGGNELAIKAVPGNLLNIDPQALLMEILSDSSCFKASDSFDAIVERVASMSCKAAVKGNNKLSYMEIKQLIDDLLKLENPYHCPHGRPTMISFSEYDLAKKFKRIV